jgi:hypothetical protein
VQAPYADREKKRGSRHNTSLYMLTKTRIEVE